MDDKEKKELVKQEKKNKKKGRGAFRKFLNTILWIVVIIWVAVCLVDFFKVRNSEDPIFCLKKETIETGTGTAEVCTGLGYKAYLYNCNSSDGKIYEGAREFGPFWTESVCDK